jgi:hypothetical protein
MGDRQSSGEACHRTTECARGVALDNQQARPVGEQWRYGLCHLPGMVPWIAAAAAMKRNAVIVAETMLADVQRVLAGQK